MTDHQNHLLGLEKQTQKYPGNVKRTKNGLIQYYQRKDKLTLTNRGFTTLVFMFIYLLS